MANRTVKDAKNIHGTNPQYLIEKIIRSRIYDSKFWKEQCFALTAELLVDKGKTIITSSFVHSRWNWIFIHFLHILAMEIRYTGGVFGSNIRPTPFLCLTLKMLQIQPEKDIVVEFIKNEEFKYVRALGAFYLRLTGSSNDCYKYLEPLYNDNRKLRHQNRSGAYEIIHMDEFIDQLLRDDRVCDIILPRIQKRSILEENNELEPKVSALDDDLDEEGSDDDHNPIEEEIRQELFDTKKKQTGKKEYEKEKDKKHQKDSDRRVERKYSDKRYDKERERDRRDSDKRYERRDREHSRERRDDRRRDDRKRGYDYDDFHRSKRRH